MTGLQWSVKAMVCPLHYLAMRTKILHSEDSFEVDESYQDEEDSANIS